MVVLDIIMIFIAIISLIISFGNLLIAFLTYLDKRDGKRKK